MEKENKNVLSLTKDDMYYLMNRDKFGKNAKLYSALFVVLSVVLGAGGCVMVAFGELLSPVILGLCGSSLGLTWIGTLLGKNEAQKNKIESDKILEHAKLIAQQQCPERLINGQTFTIVRSNNVERNLENYSFEQQMILPDGAKVVENVEREDLQIGTVSKQYVISDSEGTLGAIEETRTSDIERVSTKDGSSERVVPTFAFNWVGPTEIRPYDAEKCNPKSRKR